MPVNLQPYLPEYYLDIREFRELVQTENAELDVLRGALEQLLDDQYIETSGETAILRRELMSGIRADPKAETLGLRRSRLLAKSRSRIPFSTLTLQGIAEAYTGKPARVAIDAESLIVTFYFEESFVTNASFYQQVDKVIPSNMQIVKQGYWEDENTIEVRRSYTDLMYPFQAFASQTLYTGTKYGGPTIVNLPTPPVYNNGTLVASQSAYVTKQQAPYAITGLIYAGSSGVAIPPMIDPADQAVTYTGSLEASATYSVVTKAYRATGTVNAGTGEVI
ncbi:putative phage tail protein [Paenibacillus sp. YYML68]|uniref:putative phage tail protein n=1 Tax=Paenibacillus sp. YYML68 TaxID=2909250 RepID=UPI0024927F74|nr:putative phage tail protein [Paenibacillus sp. YYML68]